MKLSNQTNVIIVGYDMNESKQTRSNMVLSFLPWSEFACRACPMWDGGDIDGDPKDFMCHECTTDQQRNERLRIWTPKKLETRTVRNL